MRPDQFLRALIASSDDAIVGTNLDGVVFFWNEAAERLYGYASSEVLGRNISLLVPPERSEELRHLLEETRQGKAFHGFETERLRRDGTRVPLTLSMSPIHGSDGSVIGTVRTGQDQSERSRLTAAIHRSEKQAAESLSVLDILQSAAPIGFSFVDCDFRFLRVNEKAAAINGLSVEEHLGRTMAEVIPQFWPQLERAYKRVLRRGEPLLDVEVSSETAEDPGRVHSWIESLYPVRVDGEIIGVGAVFVDITERKEAERIQLSLTDALRHQALHDSLTGLPNRALIMDRAEQMLARGRRHKMGTAVLYLDIDNFKDINDTLGHQVGDQLLIELADRLVAVLRDTDTVGRIGGDEFVVLMESPEEVIEPAGSGPLEGGAPGATAATLIAERILAVLREPFDLGGSLYSITASIGIAAGPRDSAGDLLRDADVALYEAKACGKQRFVLFHPAMQRAAESHLELQMDLRAAVEPRRVLPRVPADLRHRHRRRGRPRGAAAMAASRPRDCHAQRLHPHARRGRAHRPRRTASSAPGLRTSRQVARHGLQPAHLR